MTIHKTQITHNNIFLPYFFFSIFSFFPLLAASVTKGSRRAKHSFWVLMGSSPFTSPILIRIITNIIILHQRVHPHLYTIIYHPKKSFLLSEILCKQPSKSFQQTYKKPSSDRASKPFSLYLFVCYIILIHPNATTTTKSETLLPTLIQNVSFFSSCSSAGPTS